MLSCGNCTIYAQRPQTCLDYDCRVFAAAGIDAGGADKAVINRRVHEWRFRFALTRNDRRTAPSRPPRPLSGTERAHFHQATRRSIRWALRPWRCGYIRVFLPPGPPDRAAEAARAVVAARAAFDGERAHDRIHR